MLLSMASLVIFMQLRVLYAQLVGRLRRYSNYRRILNLVNSVCPLEEFDKSKSDDAENDNQCAICWENATVARRLPCSHIFHHSKLLINLLLLILLGQYAETKQKIMLICLNFRLLASLAGAGPFLPNV